MNKISVSLLIGFIGLTGYAQKTTTSKGLFSSLIDTCSFSIKKTKPLVSKKQNFKLPPLLLSESIVQQDYPVSNAMSIIKPKGKYNMPNYFEETEDKRSLIIIDAK